MYFNCKTKTSTNPKDISEASKASQAEILQRIGTWISEGSRCTTDNVDHHYVNMVKYKPRSGSSYVELPAELRHHKKGLINVKNNDDECYRWCHLKYENFHKQLDVP